jgi:Holliday junction DNA helicase RuvB
MRPQSFADFTGQPEAIEYLKVSIASAKARNEPHDHICLAGPAGCGKSTLGLSVIPFELKADIQSINCAAVKEPPDILPAITQAKEGSILFLDEIHCLKPRIQDLLLTVLEDSKLTINIGDDKDKDIITIDLPKFTIIGATTRLGKLNEPFRNRFKHQLRLTPYSHSDMVKVLQWHATKLHIQVVDQPALYMIADHSRGVPREGLRILEGCRDTMNVLRQSHLSSEIAENTLRRYGYVNNLSSIEYKLLEILSKQTAPLGLNALSSLLDEEEETIESVLEPWLCVKGLMQRTGRGRIITPEGIKIVKRN